MAETLEEMLRSLSSWPGNVRRKVRSRLRRKRSQRVLKSWVWDDPTIVSKKIMEKTSRDIFLGASDFQDYIIADILHKRNDSGSPLFHKEITFLSTHDQWSKITDSQNLRKFEYNSKNGILIDDINYCFVIYEVSSMSIIAKINGDDQFIAHWEKLINDNFEIVTNVIEWVYGSDGHAIEIPLRGDRNPLQEMYPFLNEPLGDYYQRFMDSSASILLLIGPPGTGKTTFIRGLLQHTGTSAMVTYDPSILAKDYVFANFLEGSCNVMIIEDADNFLGTRTNGNDMMHKFLNVGDGLVTTRSKKLIFSTNLPSIKDIDSALTRPGRCFDIIKFDYLNSKQAEALASKLNLKLDDNRDKWTIAEIFHKHVAPVKINQRVGFL